MKSLSIVQAVHAAGVDAPKGSAVPGLYVCGWLKRGPTGTIGTNLTDAEETVNSIAQDYVNLQQATAGTAGLQQLLQQRRVQAVDYAGWERLNTYEQQQGLLEGSTRVKCVSVADMLRATSPNSNSSQ